MISFQPTEEQQMLIEAVKRFSENEVRKLYRDFEEERRIPDDFVETGWGLGLVEAGIPEEYDGYAEGPSSVTGVLYSEELAWGDLAVALHILTPNLFAVPLLLCGTEEQKETYLPDLCDESFPLVTAALVEPNVQYDPSALKTTAELVGGEYKLDGVKSFVPLANTAETLLIFAAEEGTTQAFLVPRDTPGLTVGEQEKQMGMDALATYTVTLEDCTIPQQNKLGGDQGCDIELILTHARVASSAMAVGVARASYEFARNYALEREAFGEPIASRQAIAFMLAEMAIDIDAARLMVWEAAWRLDQGLEANKEAYLAKVFADEMVVRVTDGGVQVLGGYGYIREFPVELWLRNGRGFAALTGIAMV